MAHDQTQRRDEASWSQEGEEHRRRSSFAPTSVCNSRAEQALTITSPSSGHGVYNQHWSPVPTYPQPHGAYYSNSGSQQPLSPEHNTVGSGTYQYHTSAVAASQTAHVASYEYPSLQPYANQYPHGAAYSNPNFPMNQGYNNVETAHLALSPSSVSPACQGPSYTYATPTASVATLPPNVMYAIPPVQSPGRSPIDAEYSVPCPYRCGTVLTGVHALGNLTRHLKTQACAGSSRAKVRYPCPIDGCERQYARSDGLRVHMRRRHGAPPPVPQTDGVVNDDED
ncbi:hypothetical protein G6011_02043 [Alternaria panax]|uniref:C2H2-type domain-containing protein n=1 Tax=Alternaria panax TaxID=48097 RepID=A0AAD4FEW5_9PLEO|nr:hypothetical protein G6011_02043 [Alternaria panax]